MPPVEPFYDGFRKPFWVQYRAFYMVQRPQSPGCDYPRTYMDYGPSRDCKGFSSDGPELSCTHIFGLSWRLSCLLALMDSARFHLITTATSRVQCPGQVRKAPV